jgi:hypothetical protein
MPLAHELADVPFAFFAHARCAGIAKVRIVGPNYNLRMWLIGPKVFDEVFERFHHVLVPQIP